MIQEQLYTLSTTEHTPDFFFLMQHFIFTFNPEIFLCVLLEKKYLEVVVDKRE